MSESRLRLINLKSRGALAAFCTYFCMYAFRKPFTAATYESQELWGMLLKDVLVLSQLAGYMTSKFIGIKVVSEMPRSRRAASIVVLILIAELALIAFAIVPVPVKAATLFVNGLALGMIFGLVLAYLEGQKQTEALAAALCASFIISSGAVKTVGSWLMQSMGVASFSMPWITGALFLIPLFVSVWMLNQMPEPTDEDRSLRSERTVMTRAHRWHFLRRFGPGILALTFVYTALTIIRTIRDDFGVELWRELGVEKEPTVFARSETLVAVFVILLNAVSIYIVSNLKALQVTIGLMCAGFVVAVGAVGAQVLGVMTPFAFMVTFGIGMYVPYVAFHTTVFERLIASSRETGNLGFLMYLVDAVGYLGYALVVLWKTFNPPENGILPLFRVSLVAISVACAVALVFSLFYLSHRLDADNATSPTPASD